MFLIFEINRIYLFPPIINDGFPKKFKRAYYMIPTQNDMRYLPII